MPATAPEPRSRNFLAEIVAELGYRSYLAYAVRVSEDGELEREGDPMNAENLGHGTPPLGSFVHAHESRGVAFFMHSCSECEPPPARRPRRPKA